MKGISRGVLILMAMGCVGVPMAWTDESTSTPAGTDQVDTLMSRYNLNPAIEKLGRGVSNVCFGGLEIPLNIHKRYALSNTGASYVTGTVYGLVKGLARTGVGAYETLTFLIPIPEDFKPILPTLEYFDRSTKRAPLPLE